ncbi:PREDICTED: structural maintenance of chromosomes protein 1B [Nanorana parkeri]|uniref:structural maintenance of chromosomes protein 1B n=1 Tax=Nanorana parkeri TaxID=125878 RepID=UPI000854CD9F|nr:PREDICTED: structural maintenance of chromosomes protein 1B [Nanorana parkeri]
MPQHSAGSSSRFKVAISTPLTQAWSTVVTIRKCPTAISGVQVDRKWLQVIRKSNLMDALSFVMGEKTSNLRVKSVRELISGANVGRPVSSTASVQLVYCDDNGEEKTFSRRIVGGSSEYRLNDTPVGRSAYVLELEKIGIISKARNCLIFQGEVESIAVKKPKERTQLFEKISNSAELSEEYERKKKVMLQAEEDAQFCYNKKKNVALERKHAKIKTLERSNADRYKRLRQELLKSKMQLQLFQLFYNENKLENLLGDLNEKHVETNSRKDQLADTESELKAAKQGLGRLNREQQQIEKEIKVLEASLNKLRPQFIKAKENSAHQMKKVEITKSSLKKSEKRCGILEQDIKGMEKEIDEVQQAWRVFDRQLEEDHLRRQADVELEQSQLDQYRLLKDEARKKNAVLGQQLEKFHWEQGATEEKIAIEQRRQKEVEVNKKCVEEQIEDYNRRVGKLEDYINTCIKALDEHRGQEEQLVREIDYSNQRMSEVNEELNITVSELQNARIDYHESNSQKRRAEILESMKRMYPDAVFGRLFELCHPIHKKYQLAVTKVFGKYMNAIVVTSERVARDCIRFLKEERAEPETFLSLDYIHLKPINEKLREVKGCKMLIDVVQCSSASLKKVVQFVCGNGLVCETVKEARHIAFDGPERQKTVSLDGTMFLKSGVISGGSSDLRFRAKRWDEKEITTLKEKRDALTSELKELMKLKRKESDLKQLHAQIQGTQTRLKYSQSELEVIKKKNLASCFAEKSRLESEFSNAECQFTMLTEELERHKVKTTDLQEQMNKLEDEVFRRFCEEIGVENIRDYEEEHVKQHQETDKKRLEFGNQKTRLEIQVEYIHEQLKKEAEKGMKLKEGLSKEEEQVTQLKKDERRYLRLVDEALSQQLEFKNHLTLKHSEVSEAQKLVEETRKKLLNINREIGKKQKEAMTIESLIEQKRLEKHNLLLDCKVQDLPITLLAGCLDDIMEVEVESESTLTATEIYEREGTFRIDYGDLPHNLKVLMTDNEFSAELMRMRQQCISHENILLKTCAPNLRALEKLQNISGKFQETTDAFETSRRKASLCRTQFEQVKKKRYELFSQCFEHVSVAIDQIYKKLCRNNSAQAFLILENSEEPYLDGIGYNCVAPGKRFMPMDNLSGGEKSVAALALVFAIHSFRPAPFFILDEVDAALDNSNIGKVTSYIKEQTRQHFQMVVISLKEEFFSKADALIGVCTEHDEMCSQVLTLDLTIYEDDEDSDSERRT